MIEGTIRGSILAHLPPGECDHPLKHREATGRDGPPTRILTPVAILYRDFGGCAIGVHPDIADKVATMQFSLPEDESQRHLGTTFHVKEGDRFVEVKTNRFAPNSAYGFARTASSWHSVKRLKMTEKPRNSIALTLYKRGKEYRSE